MYIRVVRYVYLRDIAFGGSENAESRNRSFFIADSRNPRFEYRNMKMKLAVLAAFWIYLYGNLWVSLFCFSGWDFRLLRKFEIIVGVSPPAID